MKTPGPWSPANLIDGFSRAAPHGLPKYARLREALHAAIAAGHWKPGDKLPTEQELARVTPFSLGTVQRALRELVDQGIIVRSQGSGTFVAEHRAPIDAPMHLRFLGRQGEPRYLPLYPRIVSRTRISGRGPWSDWLGQSGDNIVRIDRTLSVNDEFDVFSRFYVDAARFPQLASRPQAALDGVNFKDLIGTESGLPITNVHERISWVKFPPEARAFVGMKKGAQALLLESAASAGRSDPVYFLESFIPPTDRHLEVSPG